MGQKKKNSKKSSVQASTQAGSTQGTPQKSDAQDSAVQASSSTESPEVETAGGKAWRHCLFCQVTMRQGL